MSTKPPSLPGTDSVSRSHAPRKVDSNFSCALPTWPAALTSQVQVPTKYSIFCICAAFGGAGAAEAPTGDDSRIAAMPRRNVLFMERSWHRLVTPVCRNVSDYVNEGPSV